MVHPSSPIKAEMRRYFEYLCMKYDYEGLVELQKENGVYNMSLRVSITKPISEEDLENDVCLASDDSVATGPLHPLGGQSLGKPL